jgi:hypothetical protein
MKKLVITIVAFLFAIQFSNAQFEKGDQTLGFSIGLQYNKTNQLIINPYDQSQSTQNGKTTSINVGPNYSYFIADKLDIGASLNYNTVVTNYGSNTYTDQNKSVYRNYGGSIYLRKYFMYANKIGIRTGPYVSYYRAIQQTNYTGDNSLYNYNSKGNAYAAGVNLDLVYYASKCFGVSASIASLNYTHDKETNGNQGNSNSDNFGFYFTNGLSLSMFYAFGGK